MNRKIIFGIICFFLFSNECISQIQKDDTIYIKKFPVKNGSINLCWKCISECNSPSLYIGTTSDSVFHFENGIVVNIFSIEDEKAVLIKNEDSVFICYAGLEKNYVEKGDSVFTNTFIGKLKMNEEKKFELHFLVVKSGKYYYQKELIDFLNNRAWGNTLRIEN